MPIFSKICQTDSENKSPSYQGKVVIELGFVKIAGCKYHWLLHCLFADIMFHCFWLQIGCTTVGCRYDALLLIADIILHLALLLPDISVAGYLTVPSHVADVILSIASCPLLADVMMPIVDLQMSC